MHTSRLRNRWVLRAVVGVSLSLSGCIKEITSDERLERETKKSDASKTSTAGDLLRLKCDDLKPSWNAARDEQQTEEKRLVTYIDVYDEAKKRTQQFDDAMNRNPDLNFQETAQELVSARDGCNETTADVRREFETLVREVTQVPVVDDYKSGQQVKVPRLSFDKMREAVTKLELDDKEALLLKISQAEKTVETVKGDSGGKKKK
jgi:outer membrane murein-binding lipoprotein Lpp